MLTLTPAAVEAVRNIASTSGVPEEGGLRIAAAAGNPQGAEELQLSVAAGPAEQDHVLTEEGAHVFLDEHASAYLDDKILHAELNDDGQATFALAEQDGATAGS